LITAESNNSNTVVFVQLSIRAAALGVVSKGLPPPVVGLGEFVLLILLAVLDSLEEVDVFAVGDDDEGEERVVVEKVDCVVDVLVSLDRLFVVGVVVEVEVNSDCEVVALV
jgi:hypothetical protein